MLIIDCARLFAKRPIETTTVIHLNRIVVIHKPVLCGLKAVITSLPQSTASWLRLDQLC